MHNTTRRTHPLLFMSASFALITVVFSILITTAIFTYKSDWSTHIDFIIEFMTTGKLYIIHMGFHALVLILSGGQVIGVYLAAFAVGIISVNLTFYLVYRWLRRIPRIEPTNAILAALAILVVSPITLLTANKSNLYLGYIGFNTMHSPTVIFVKPFTLLLFGFLITIMMQEVELTIRRIVAVITLCIVSTFAKPNFAMSLLPALAVIFLWRLIMARRSLDKTFVTWSLIVGGSLVGTLALQYVAQYAFIDSDGGNITFAPLVSLLIYEPSALWLIIKFIMSIAFPVTITILYRRYLRDAVALQVAWLIFVFGALQMYLLTETGERSGHGNFWWSAQIGLFILFLTALAHLLRYKNVAARWRYWTAFTIFIIHLTSGAAFLVLRLFAPTQSAFW